MTIHLLPNCVVMCLRELTGHVSGRWTDGRDPGSVDSPQWMRSPFPFFVRLPSVSSGYDAVECVGSDGLNVSRDTNDHVYRLEPRTWVRRTRGIIRMDRNTEHGDRIIVTGSFHEGSIIDTPRLQPISRSFSRVGSIGSTGIPSTSLLMLIHTVRYQPRIDEA